MSTRITPDHLGCAAVVYAKTKIDEADGERWFCSEAEAVAAGWRAVRS